MTLYIENMEVAGELIQDMASFLQIKQLNSTASFSTEIDKFSKLLDKVNEYNAIRLKQTADMADNSQVVKTLVIKAEDLRILGDMSKMRFAYEELHNMNNNLLKEYNKRTGNQEALLACLKDVNQMIQKASRLRVGDCKTKVVTESRNAIKNNNIKALFNLVQNGVPYD